MGYGFDEGVTAHELAHLVPTGIPTAIVLDSGSTDSGPEKLALGNMTCPRAAYVNDLTKLLRLVHTFRVPLIFSSAGGDGSDDHVKEIGEILEEITATQGNEGYGFKTISIFSNIDKSVITQRLRSNRITGCGPCVPPLTQSSVDDAPHVVAQMGPEPFLDAMESDPDFDIIVGGRAYDPAPYVAYSLFQLKQQHPHLTSSEIQSRYGGFLHMGKIMECGGQCSTPKSHGAVATLYPSGDFEVRATAPGSKCTALSVAAHTLYENTRPDLLKGPGGTLDLRVARYEELTDGKSVKVSGSKYRSSKADGVPYQFKLEGARVVGYRSMALGSVKDHVLIKQLDGLLDLVKQYVASQHPDIEGEWDLDFHTYGKGQSTSAGPGEVFIVAEAIAPTQKLATSIASKARVGMIHGAYPGQKATAGNFAFGIGGKTEIETGPCAQFCVYHLMELDTGDERLRGKLLRSSVAIVGKGKRFPSDEAFRSSIRRLQGTLPPAASRQPFQASASHGKSAAGLPQTLSDVCRVLRSKNAGPYEITLDAIFETQDVYNAIKNSGLLSKDNVAKALGIAKGDILWSGFFDPALAFKVTIPRVRGGKRVAAGGFMEGDVHGSQQHLRLATMNLPSAMASGSADVGTTVSFPGRFAVGASSLALVAYFLPRWIRGGRS